ncbi:endo alpha-1,4 polygalactosaminidase [Planosporangium sp. 12N6]|uniref:endo alpha-1,4 polygalactosaminidase n=1 Tax=Planosporangium spinosum TaxID=3402278 RepID=UPI003CEB801D
MTGHRPMTPTLVRRLTLPAVCAALLSACTGGGTPPPPVPEGPSPHGSATSTGAAPGTATPPSTASVPPPGARRWVPAPGTPWQWQLTTPVDTGVDVPVYDIDGVENGPDVVRSLHAKGRKVICYVNAGAAETFRPDYHAFPPRVLGKPNGWKGERSLDIRRLDVLRPIMAARFDLCRGSGFDAVEADLVDGYTNDTGFPLSAGDQLAYNRMLADLAHQRGLSIGLKNDLDQVPQLVGDFDFAVNEECARYGECDKLTPFIRAGKAVFHVEYGLDNARFCAQARALRFSSMRKNLDLDAPRWPC